MTQIIGYACINTHLKKSGITTNRGVRKVTLNRTGNQLISQLALQNAKDLCTIIKWNADNNIKLFRISSDLFPWGNKTDITQLPDYREIRAVLESAGKLAREYGQRLGAHPGPFNLLASPKESVILDTIADLELHSQMFDMIGLETSPYNKINIHIGATYGDKLTATKTWIKNYKRLSANCRSRMTIENDDKASMFSVRDLHQMVHQEIGIPIVFDYHHHKFNTGDLNEREALELAMSTWPGIIPVVHYSESKALHENDSKIRPQAHSDYLSQPVNTYGHEVHIMLECKMKEDALLKYRRDFLEKKLC